MNFLEAVKALKEGKKIRRITWIKNSYISGTDPVTFQELGPAAFSTKQFEADDWEIFEEKKEVKMERDENNNNVFEEFSKFIKKDVIVKYHEGNNVIELKGNLRFLSFNSLSCVIMTDKEKIIVKNIITIRRERGK